MIGLSDPRSKGPFQIIGLSDPRSKGAFTKIDLSDPRSMMGIPPKHKEFEYSTHA